MLRVALTVVEALDDLLALDVPDWAAVMLGENDPVDEEDADAVFVQL